MKLDLILLQRDSEEGAYKAYSWKSTILRYRMSIYTNHTGEH